MCKLNQVNQSQKGQIIQKYLCKQLHSDMEKVFFSLVLLKLLKE